jgi:hypothetical protein
MITKTAEDIDSYARRDNAQGKLGKAILDVLSESGCRL